MTEHGRRGAAGAGGARGRGLGRAGSGASIVVVLLTAACAGERPASESATAAAAPDASATFCKVEREYMRLADGGSMYVEPQSLFAMGSRWMVAGLPTYTWWPGGSPTAVRKTRHAHVAARLGPPGTSVAFATPIEGFVHVVRGVSLGGTRWAVLLFEYEADPFPDTGRLLAAYYVEHDGEGWSTPQRLELPDEELRAFESSALVNADGRLLWAVAKTVPTGQAPLVLYERQSGRWTFRTIAEKFTERLALGWDGSAVWLVVTGEDPDLPEWRRSVRLYREVRPDAWELVSRIWVAPLDTNVLSASLTLLEEGATVTWHALGPESHVSMARVGIGPDDDGTLVILDTSPLQTAALAMPDGRPAWLVDHVNALTGIRELRLLREEAGRVVRVGSLPNPYTPYFAAGVTDAGEVFTVGGVFHENPIQPTVRSLTLRLSTACD